MAAFSYNKYSSESYENQYRKYLQNHNYVSHIDNAIRVTGEMNAAVVAIKSREVQDAIEASSQEQKEVIIQLRDTICSSLDSGFNELFSGLTDLNDGINGLSNLVGHGFSLMAEGHKIFHQYLGQIQNLLRIPDSQKERVYHIEEGMKYLQNAFRQSSESDFYTDALEEFEKSESIEKKDFFSLFYIGFICLKSSKHLNPKVAEKYFRNSARYYLAEAIVGGTNLSNNLLESHRGFFLEAAEAFLFAAEACYIQEKYLEASELAAEAWKTFPEMTKAGFFYSKYLAVNNQVKEAVNILEKAIRLNRYLSMEVLSDLDLISKPEIIILLERLRAESISNAKEKYDLCRSIILPDSIAFSYLESINKLIQLGTFLEAQEATDMLLEEKKWTIDAANIAPEGNVIAKISSQEFKGSVVDFVKFERERILALPQAYNLIRIAEIKKQEKELDEKLEEQINIIKKNIDNLQRQSHNNYAEFSEKWKKLIPLFVAIAIYLPVCVFMGNAKGFIVVLICGVFKYVGVTALVISLMILIFISMSILIKNWRLNYSIAIDQTEISRLIKDLEIKKSQLNRFYTERWDVIR